MGRDVIVGNTSPPAGTTKLEYAVYNLLHAVEDLSLAIKPKGDDKP